MSAPRIRGYRPEDREDVFDVCVRTADSGSDATGLVADESLLPDVFAAPYLDLQPDLAFVVDTGERVVGYVLAAADTASWVQRYRAEYLPGFAARHPLTEPPTTREERIVWVGHHPELMIVHDLVRFPAHLHIDLLPEAQGRGLGRALIRVLLGELRARGVPGVQLRYGETNHGAGAFYRRLGFHTLPSTPDDPYALAIESGASSEPLPSQRM